MTTDAIGLSSSLDAIVIGGGRPASPQATTCVGRGSALRFTMLQNSQGVLGGRHGIPYTCSHPLSTVRCLVGGCLPRKAKLFKVASQRQAAERTGVSVSELTDLGDIVMVPSLRSARDRGMLRTHPMFTAFSTNGITWNDGSEWHCDVIIWCTGFRPELTHLAPLNLTPEEGMPRTRGTRSIDESRLHLLGYGDWSGVASATIIGAGRTPRAAVAELSGL